MKKIIPFILLLPSLAFAGDWDKTDKILYGSYLSLEVVDCLQTRYAMNRPDQFSERNQLIEKVGAKNVVAYSAVEVLGVLWLSDKISPKYRKGFLVLATSVNIWCIRHNYKAGIKFRF